MLSQFDFARDLIARVEAGELTEAEAYELLKTENTLYTVCLNCNTGCGIKVKIIDGVAVKIDGNPYNPFTLHPHLEMKEYARVSRQSRWRPVPQRSGRPSGSLRSLPDHQGFETGRKAGRE